MNRKLLHFRACWLILLIPLASCFVTACQGGKTDQSKRQPVVRWTAGADEMNFRYNFLSNIETITLYTATPETGTFSHHSHITYLDGIFYAWWDNQVKDENGSGQRGLLRRSTDHGKTWTLAEELFPSLDKMVPASEAYIGTIFQTANGFALVDGVLYAVTDVAEWTGPGIAERSRISYGQLFRSVGPDDTLGDIYWLKEDPSPPAEGFPAYPAGDPELVKRIKTYFEQPGQEIQLIFTKPHPVSDDNHRLTEPTVSWSLEDGTLVRLYRDSGHKEAETVAEEEETKSRRNYAVFSSDNGETWSVPTRTSFPDACARSNAGKLPDGQVYLINNILPLSPKKGGRSLLAISLSRDGLNFDRTAVIRFLPPPMRYDGRAKSVGYQYPHSVVVGDDLWVMYSVNKEDIQLSYLPLKELYNIK